MTHTHDHADLKQPMNPDQTARSRRNLLIFVLVSITCGWLGVALDALLASPRYTPGLGMLLWILAPAVAACMLRAWGGDGWQDAAWRPRCKAAWGGYVLALLLFPLLSLLVFVPAIGLGACTVRAGGVQGWMALAPVFASVLVGTLVKNIFEEWAWRGYLTGRLAALGIRPLYNHGLTGLVWASWHVPYWLYFVDVRSFTELDPYSFAAWGALILLISAVTYGELRLLCQSVWPGVLLHSVANAVTAALVLNAFVDCVGVPGLLLAPDNRGLLHACLFAGVGWVLYRVRRRLIS